ncbi:hypothetical protein BMETH_2095_0 [methanotrophic bacterial endosymbiont of Bathymodiolus sp.]|nr:hypothetical protein BMETH_2095_0 [methanotrophic bacterial endosymbiont of Bathymodiolus sp.]
MTFVRNPLLLIPVSTLKPCPYHCMCNGVISLLLVFNSSAISFFNSCLSSLILSSSALNNPNL